jgi:hypothetical protein
MKKPKTTKFPKQPRVSASPDVWERYYKRCVDVKKRNDEKLRPFRTKQSKIETIKNQVARLKGRK